MLIKEMVRKLSKQKADATGKKVRETKILVTNYLLLVTERAERNL